MEDDREIAVDSRFPEQFGTPFVAAASGVGRAMMDYASEDPVGIGLVAE